LESKDDRSVRVAKCPSTPLRQLHQPGQLNLAGRDERHYFVWARVGQAVNRDYSLPSQRRPSEPSGVQLSARVPGGLPGDEDKQTAMPADLPRLQAGARKGNCNIQRQLPEL
jgi:hypothetical protein